MENTNYKDLKKEYSDLKLNYIRNKNQIKDLKRDELITLKEEYKINKLKIEKPLKAEKYALKVEQKRINRKKNEPPHRLLLEEIGNSVTHGVGAIIALACLVLMLIKSNSPLEYVASSIYGTCFFLQMLFSCLYHSFRSGSTVKRIFRRFDYSTIYLQIGGTFAPLFLIYMNEHMWGLTASLIFFCIQWALIITGITFVGVFGPGRLRWLHFSLYFLIGWSAVIFIPYWINDSLLLFFWILGGGLVYTFGMIPFAALRKKPCAHFIWHFFVLIGAIVQWVGIYLYLI